MACQRQLIIIFQIQPKAVTVIEKVQRKCHA